MKALYQCLPLLIALLLGASLFSCKTVNEYPVSNDEHNRKFADVKLSLQFLDREDLIARHDEEANPFIDFPGGLMDNKSIMVFELEIESTETSIIIPQKHITLDFGDRIAKPISEYLLKELWEEHHANSRVRGTRNKTIGDTVSQGELKATPNKPLSTYLVFRNKFPMFGDALVSMPIMTADLNDQATIEFPFEFKLAYIDASKADPATASHTENADSEEEKKSIFE